MENIVILRKERISKKKVFLVEGIFPSVHISMLKNALINRSSIFMYRSYLGSKMY